MQTDTFVTPGLVEEFTFPDGQPHLKVLQFPENVEAYKNGISVDDIPDLRIFSAPSAQNSSYEGLWFKHYGKLYTMPRLGSSYPKLEDRMGIDGWGPAIGSVGKVSAVLPFEAKID